MNCPACDSNNWHDAGLTPANRPLVICRDCGMVVAWADEATMVRSLGRIPARQPVPTHQDVIRTNRVRATVGAFIGEWLDGKSELNCLHVEAGMGFLAGWLKSLGHRATGTSWALSLRRFANHYYGVTLTEEADESCRYDLIILRNVLKHIPAPAAYLRHLASLMTENGRLLVMEPEWFSDLQSALGNHIGGPEQLYPVNCLNLFSAGSLTNVFRRAGLSVEKEDHVSNQKYLLRLSGSYEELPITPEDWREKDRQIAIAGRAVAAFQAGEFEKAVQLWPAFPDAWSRLLFSAGTRQEERERYLDEAVSLVGNTVPFRLGRLAHEVNRKGGNLAQAVDDGRWLMQNGPRAEIANQLAHLHEARGERGEALSWLRAAWELDPLLWEELVARFAPLAAKVSMPDEPVVPAGAPVT